jgi:hypothetical protein
MRPHPAFPEGKKQGGILWPQDATSGEILRGNGYYQETIMNIVQNSFPPCFLCNVEVYEAGMRPAFPVKAFNRQSKIGNRK